MHFVTKECCWNDNVLIDYTPSCIIKCRLRGLCKGSGDWALRKFGQNLGGWSANYWCMTKLNCVYLFWLTASVVTAITLWCYEDNCCNVTLCIAIPFGFNVSCYPVMNCTLYAIYMACAVIYYALLNNFLSCPFPKLRCNIICICMSCLLCIVTCSLLWLSDKMLCGYS